jgi:hypothetical protein
MEIGPVNLPLTRRNLLIAGAASAATLAAPDLSAQPAAAAVTKVKFRSR